MTRPKNTHQPPDPPDTYDCDGCGLPKCCCVLIQHPTLGDAVQCCTCTGGPACELCDPDAYPTEDDDPPEDW